MEFFNLDFVHWQIDIQSLTTVKELPESGAISILVQFMLLGPEENNKAEYLAGLISRKQVDKLGLNQHALNLSTIRDVASKESELSCFSNRVHLPTADPLASCVGLTVARYDSYASLYSSSLSAQPLSSRVGFGKMEESNPTPLHQTPDSSSTSYSKVRLDYLHIAAADCQHTRPQVRFDPFTGEPYKFDPFTGEPILPERLPYHFGSPY